MKNSTIEEIKNPFTMKGLLTAIIDDLNDLRKRIEYLEKRRIFQYYENFIIKDKNSKNDK